MYSMTSFSDQLEDFGAKVEKPAKDDEHPDQFSDGGNEGEVDSSVRFQAEEIEALKAEAYEKGRQDGIEKAEAALSDNMTTSIGEILTFVSQEGVRRSELLHQLADMFTEALCAIVKELVSGELKRDVIRRDMLKDIASFAKDCEGEVTLSCSKEDAVSVKSVLKDIPGVFMKINPELPTGRATVSSSEAEITVDKNEWVNEVRDRVITSVKSIIQTKQSSAETRTLNNGR